MYCSRFFHEYVLAAGNAEPGRLAIASATERWSFADLRAKVQELAFQIGELGVGVGQRVLVLLHPSPSAIAIELATSSLGAAFVPLSPEMPLARVSTITAAVKPRLIVLDETIDPTFVDEPYAVIARLIRGKLVLSRNSPVRSASRCRRLLESDPAYLIFTSGSTGEPKGIVMSHGAAVSALSGAAEMPIRDHGPVASTAPLQFDFSILDMGLSLSLGRPLCLVPRLVSLDPERLARYLLDFGVSQLDGVPSLLGSLAASTAGLKALAKTLRTIVYGGEAFSPPEVEALQTGLPGTRVIQAFGHSESILCCFAALDRPAKVARGRITIGKPFRSMEMFLFDGEEEVRDPGRAAELWIRGPCLFSGYWDEEAATARALQPDPRYRACNDRTFRSGDLVFRDEEGDYYFAGRLDAQVKVGGNRLELEEVEAVLEADEAVLKAVVAVAESAGRRALVAFVVPRRPLDTEALAAVRRRCGDRLPHYAVPRQVIAVDTVPTTFNGKADRKRLLKAAAGEPN